MANNLRVHIDPDRCVGYGRCAAVATGVFMATAFVTVFVVRHVIGG